MALAKNLFLILALLPLFGCTSVSTTKQSSQIPVQTLNGDKNGQILVSNYGYYLFNCIPLFCGGKDEDSLSFFSDNVNIDKAMQCLSKKCEQLNVKNVADIQATTSSTCFLSWVPTIGSTLGIYWYKQVQISAVVER